MMTQSIETILLTLLVLLTLAMLTDAASAQQRTFYDAGGKVSGRSDHRQQRRGHELRQPWPGHQPRDHQWKSDDDL
jgi:Spy/CpxP family protein refolding chaperone